MAMLVMFREDHGYSPYRGALLDLISAPGDELVLSYGFITDVFSNTHSKSFGTAFLNEIAANMGNGGTIRLIAGYFEHGDGSRAENDYKTAYTALVGVLNNDPKKRFTNIDLRPKVDVHKISQDKWHAKIALKIKNTSDGKKEVTAALIGSSNLSGNSVNEFLPGAAVYPLVSECDVYFWNGRIHKSNFHSNVHKKSEFTSQIDIESNNPDEHPTYKGAYSVEGSLILQVKPVAPLKIIFEFLLSKVRPYFR